MATNLPDDDLAPACESANTPTHGLHVAPPPMAPPTSGTPKALTSELRKLVAEELSSMRRELAKTAQERCHRALDLITQHVESMAAPQENVPTLQVGGAWMEVSVSPSTSTRTNESLEEELNRGSQKRSVAFAKSLSPAMSPTGMKATSNFNRLKPQALGRKAVDHLGRNENLLEKFRQKRVNDTQDMGHGTISYHKSFHESFNGSMMSTASGGRGGQRRRPNKPAKAVFANASDMKERIMKDLHTEQYKVEDHYKTEGYCQDWARSQWFENMTLVVIVLNALWIGYETDQNPADLITEAGAGFQLVEHLFCMFFTAELSIRFGAFLHTWQAFVDKQFVFDVSLLLLMWFETWVVYIIVALSPPGFANNMGNTSALSLFRMLRLIRTARLTRLFRAVPELMILIKGVAVAARSVFWTLSLLFLLIYVFAICLLILTKDTAVARKYFPSLPGSMSTLMLRGLLPDSAGYVYDIDSYSPFVAVIFSLFIVVGLVTVMNLLVGVLVEVVGVVAKTEREQMAVNFVKEEMNTLVEQELDRDAGGMISKSELEELLISSGAAKIISDVGVDIAGLVDIADYQLFHESTNVPFSKFVELVLQLRGTNNATVRDVIDMRKFVMQELSGIEERLANIIKHATGVEVEDPSPSQQVEGPQRPRAGLLGGRPLGLLRDAAGAGGEDAILEEPDAGPRAWDLPGSPSPEPVDANQ
mmetsp:Transcript_98392/g.254417  ORF Transcript_98392/g.254417 Transcript_98392/m.254417 type:complete len:704 (-) Transcript_98392:135-2246(-)